MTRIVLLRRGSTSDHTSGSGFAGQVGEVTVDTTNNTLRVHDGLTKGGTESVGVNVTQTLTNKTLGAGTTISGTAFAKQLNISGISTLGITTVDGLVSKQLNVSGVSTFAGITTVTGDTLFTKQLNVSGVSTFAGITTVTGDTLFTKQLNVSGVSTLGNTVIGGGTTQLVVNGNVRITGILTVGTASITFDGNNNTINVGSGITFNGSTGIISATEFRGNGANLTGVQPFPSGTIIPFHQSAAPTGWTKLTTHDNKALRVVSGTGGGSGGTSSFTSVFASRTPGGSVTMANAAVTLTTAQIPSHSHFMFNVDDTGGANATASNLNSFSSNNPTQFNTGNSGSGGSHTHANTASFTGTAMDFAVQYIDVIIASKD